MGKSWKKTISFGKSDNGVSSRCKKTWGDYQAEKARRDGKPIRRQHRRHTYQTLEDYISYVKNHFKMNSSFNDMYDRKRFEDYQKFLDGREETNELIEEFALKLYNKDRSK